jgi:hypothetical protein
VSVDDHVKVLVNLEPDDGWPPYEVEGVWATHEHDNIYRLDNIPFYARGISDGDLIRAEPDADGVLTFLSVERPSWFSTVRVFVKGGADKEEVRQRFRKIECDSEGISEHLFTLSIPRPRLGEVLVELERGEVVGEWDWEEGVLRK